MMDGRTRSDIIFEVTATDPDASFGVVESAVRLFQATVELGMYSTAFAASTAPVFEIVDAGASLGGVFRQHWQVRGFSHHAFRVFLNLMRVIHYRQVPLESIRLQSPAASDAMVDGTMLLSAAYPARAEPLPFPLQILRRLDGIKSPCLRLDLASDINDPQFARFEAALSTWDHLVMRGGYEGDFVELDLDDSVVIAETYMTAPRTLEHMLHDTIPLAQAFDALLNMIARLHMTVCPVMSIEIE